MSPSGLPRLSTTDFTERLKRGMDRQRPTKRFSVGSPSAPRTVACLVTHGMGQQVRFDTCAQLAQAFVQAEGRRPDSVKAGRRQLTPGADLLACMELHYLPHDGHPEITLHIYEGYWAPLTEGKITYWQVVRFLFSAGFHAVPHSFRPFPRWIFGAMQTLRVKPGTLFALLSTILFLAFGIAIISLYGVEITRLAKVLALHLERPLLPLLGMIVRHPLRSVWHLLVLLFAAHPIFKAVTLLLTAVYVWAARLFLIEYMGDIVIYVSSYQVSFFQEVRDAIQKAVLDVAKQIFLARAPDPASSAAGSGFDAPDPATHTEPLYDEVLFVGHSLGSVITYDTLNALIVWDVTGCNGQHNVLGRTSRLITFGSPLDKTAFLFRTQPTRGNDFREAMAGNMQPLILDYQLRPFEWVNLYSHMDIVSGNLAFYDLPQALRPPGAKAVHNFIDRGARAPIYAHIQYWDKPFLRKQLISALNRTPPPAS